MQQPLLSGDWVTRGNDGLLKSLGKSAFFPPLPKTYGDVYALPLMVNFLHFPKISCVQQQTRQHGCNFIIITWA